MSKASDSNETMIFMKFLIDARFFGTEAGIGRYVKEIIENLEKIDLQNEYVVFLRKKNWGLYNPKNFNFKKKLADFSWYSLEEQVKLGRLVDAERADLCFFPHFNVPYFCKTPYVVMIHDLILRHFPKSNASTKNPVIFYLKYFFYNLILRRALKKSKKIIAPSYFVRNDIISQFGISPDKVRVIYEGLSNLPREADLGREYLRQKGITKPYILYVGNAYPHKNLELLCKAFLELKDENLQLVLVGKRDYFSKRLENNINIPNSILFYGYASETELATLYKHAGLYAFPSLMEGFGLPALEALSFGLPIICSDIPVFNEILGERVKYFNSKDKDSIKDAIKENFNKKEPINFDFFKKYSWKNTTTEIFDIFRKTC